VQTAGKWKLRSQSVSRRKHSRLKLSCVSLHLVAMLIHTPEIIRPAVDIQHTSCTVLTTQLSCSIIRPQLNPVRLQWCLDTAPLPPRWATYSLNACRSKLFLNVRGSSVDVVSRYRNIFCAYPVWCRHPLTGEGLNIFDCVVGAVDEELADEVEADVVGDVGGGLLMEGFAVEVLRSSY